MMGNHGILIAAETPVLAWNLASHLERACKNYITALSTGRPLSILTDEVAEKTAQQREDYDRTTDYQQQHLDAMMAVLDVKNPGYAL
jgi:ribulose-5-phosphate 4-epimerase/fuculose-1-phosphate aldolase